MRKSRMTPPRLLVASSAVFVLLWFALAGAHRAALAVEAGQGAEPPREQALVVQQAASQPRMAVDTPRDGALVPGSFTISGWAIDLASTSGPGVDAVHVYLDPGTPQGRFLGAATLGGSRPDVAAAFGGSQFTNSGWSLTASSIAPGDHTIWVAARSTVAQSFNNSVLIRIRVSSSEPRIHIDSPSPGSTIRGAFTVSGWAIDLVSQSGTGIDAVHVYLDPGTSQGRFLGAATLGGSRPDVDAAFSGGGRFVNSGWSLGVSQAPPAGTHVIGVAAHSSLSGQWTWATVSVTVPVPRSEVRTSIDLPLTSPQLCATSFDVTGWAIDLGATSNPGVDAVHVYADPGTSSGRFLGAATLGGDRPDVAAAFNGSQYRFSGWSLHVPTALSPGSHLLAVAVHSTVSGQWTWFTKTVHVPASGPSTIAAWIDNPAPSSAQQLPVTISGWALDTGSNTGTGVSSVHVYADLGTPLARFLGVATTGVPRPDVAAAYNSQCYQGAGYSVNTTNLEPGTHTLHLAVHSTVSGGWTWFGPIVFTQAPQPSWTEKSDLRVQNASTSQSTLVFEYFDTVGVPIAGASAAQEQVAGGTWRAAAVRDNPSLPAGFQGTATVSSDQPLGLAHLLQVNRGTTSHALRTGTGAGSTTVHVPALVASNPEYSRLLITNLSSTNPACVRVRFIPESGADIVDQGTMDGCPGGGWYVPPRGSLLRDLQDLQRGGVIPPGFRGSAVVDQLSGTSALLVATVDLWRDGQSAFAGYNAGTPGDTTVYLPAIDNGRWPNSSVTVQNVGTGNITVNPPCGTPDSAALAVGQAATFSLSGCPAGTTITASGPIQAVVVLRGNSGEMAAYEAVPASQTSGTLWLPYLASGDNAAYTAGETWTTETWVMETAPTGDPSLSLFNGSAGCGNASRTPVVGNELFKFTGTGSCGASASGRLTGSGTYAAVTVVVSGGNPESAYTAIKAP